MKHYWKVPSFVVTIKTIKWLRLLLLVMSAYGIMSLVSDGFDFWETHVSIWWPQLHNATREQALAMWSETKVFLWDFGWVCMWTVLAIVMRWIIFKCPVPSVCYTAWSEEVLPPRVAHWMMQELLWSPTLRMWQLRMIEDLARREVEGHEEIMSHEGKAKLWSKARIDKL